MHRTDAIGQRVVEAGEEEGGSGATDVDVFDHIHLPERSVGAQRLGESLRAPENFMLVVSYNPGYQSVLKDLKQSTRQRMVAIEMNYPLPDKEIEIVMQESGIDRPRAADLVKLANAIRKLDASSLPEVSSTRTLVSTARLMKEGLTPRAAATAAMLLPLTDDAEITRGLGEIIATYLES